jgi:hypothetical protein
MQLLRTHQRVPHSLLNHSNCRYVATPVYLQRCGTRLEAVQARTAAVNLAVQDHATPAAAGAAAAGLQQHALFAWVRQNKGYVHPALAIVDHAPCGCRGVIAVSDVSMPVQNQHGAPAAAQAGSQQLPLIAVPEQLYMTTDDALDILGTAIVLQQQQQQQQQQQHSQHSTASGLQQLLARFSTLGFGQQEQQQQQLVGSLQRLQPPLLLALLLAFERSKGPESFWYPYISNLPEEPPCAWFTALQQQQQQQPVDITPDEVAAAAAAVASKCTAAAAMYGPALGGCIAADDVVWAYGQVVSRAFGNGRDVAFAPLIDMLNHQLVR